MAVTWGSARTTSTNGFRVGLELRASGSGASRTIYWEIWLATRRASYGSSSNYSVSGAVSRSGTFSHSHTNNSSDWPSSNETLIASGSFSRTLNYGSTQTVSISGSISGISAVSGTATHSRSITLPARAYEVPAAPTGAYAYIENNATQVRLVWTRNHTTSAPWEKVQVQRRYVETDGVFSAWVTRANLSGTATTYTDPINDNWHYHYRVRAGNSSGWSDWLDMGRANSTPSTPTNVVAQYSGTDITLTWDHNSRQNRGDTYAGNNLRTRIERSINGGTWSLATTLANLPTSWRDTGINPVNTYRYRVRLEVIQWGDAVGNYGTSNTVEIATPPNPPTNLGPTTPHPADEGVTLNWRHAPTDGSEQTSFRIRRRRQGQTTWTTLARQYSSTEEYFLSSIPYSAGQTMEWQVETWGTHGTSSGWSSSGFLPLVSRPTVAINFPENASTVNSSTVDVVWGYSGSGGVQTGWRVRLYREDTGDLIVNRNGNDSRSTLRITGLENDTDYRLEVEVRGGDGLWSAAPEVAYFSTAFLPPPQPWIESAEWDRDTGGVNIAVGVPPWEEGSFVSRTNLVKNPSFETSLASVSPPGWVSRSTDPDNAFAGTGSLVHTNPGGKVYQEVDLPADSEGWWLGFSLVGRRSLGTGLSAYIGVDWVNSAGTVTEDDAIVQWTLTSAPMKDQPRRVGAAQIPAGAVKARVWIRGDVNFVTDAWLAVVGSTQAQALSHAMTYFDGSTPNRPLVTYAWTGTAHNSTTTETQASTAEPLFLRLERSINGGPWVLVMDQIPLDTVIQDPIPVIGDGTENRYRVTAVSALPSASQSEEVTLAVTTRMTRGWAYLNAGTDMSVRTRVRANLERGDSDGHEKELRQFAGRDAPVEFVSPVRRLEWDISVRIAPNPDGGATRQDLLDVQAAPGPVCYRDPLGARWFGSMSRPDFSWQRITGEVSVSFTRIDVVEGVGDEEVV